MSIKIQPKVVIFDNDGVLIDSEIVWHRINALEMSRLGFQLTVDESISLFGTSPSYDFNDIILKKYGKKISSSDIASINRKVEEAYLDELKPIPNIDICLEYLIKNQINYCIASNADREYIARTLEITKLSQYFCPEQIFGTDEHIAKKPKPDVFLKASTRYGAEPKNHLVIEDHPLGIEAAQRANMQVVGFLGASHLDLNHHHKLLSQAKPNEIIKNAEALLCFFESLFAK